MLIDAQKFDGHVARKRQTVAHFRQIRWERGCGRDWLSNCVHACAAGAKGPRQQIHRLYFILLAGFEDAAIAQVVMEGSLLQLHAPKRVAAEVVPGTGIEPVRTFRSSGF